MSLEPHEELKLAWELHQMEADVRLKIEQARWEPTRVFIAGATAFAAILAAVFGGVGIIIGYSLRRTGH